MKFKQSLFNMSAIYATRIFDKLMDKATNNTNLEPDWNTILQVCDAIRQNDITPKYAILAIKRKLYSENPHQVYYTLLTLESMMKNCGPEIHDEVATKAFSETLHERLKHTTNERNKTKILDLIQAWSIAFRKIPKYRPIQDMANIIRAEGYCFPSYNESDAMFSAKAAPKFITGEVCHRCRVPFSLILRRHHCRACGQPFCQQCSANTTILPQFGIEKEVRVCENCYDKYAVPSSSKVPKRTSFSFSYKPKVNPVQSAPVKPTPGPSKQNEDLKLQEEDDLQLALALSKSEAEHKEIEKRTRSFSASSARRPKPPLPKLTAAASAPNTGVTSEMNHYLDRQYWEKRAAAAPTAPESNSPRPSTHFAKPSPTPASSDYDDLEDKEIEKFIELLRSQVEIFVNRMKSDSSRGRPIANDSSVQGLFINITAMHSRLLQYIEKVDDKRVYLESLQDKVSQVRDSRAALDLLRTEHAAHLAAVQKAAQTVKQSQMAAKLQTLRQKKHEYLQYQRQLALQRVQDHERELQMRQEQFKQQSTLQENNYLYGSSVNQMPNNYMNRNLQGNQSWRGNNASLMTTDPVQNTQPTLSSANLARGFNQKERIAPCTSQFGNALNCSKQNFKEVKNQGSVLQTISQPNVRSTLSQLGQNQDMMAQQMQWMPYQQGHQLSQNINGHQNRNISLCQQNDNFAQQEQMRNQNMLQNYSQSINNNLMKSYNSGMNNNPMSMNQHNYSLDLANSQMNQYNPIQQNNLQQPSQSMRIIEQPNLPTNPNQFMQNSIANMSNNFQYKTLSEAQRQLTREREQNMNNAQQNYEISTNVQSKIDPQILNTFNQNVMQQDLRGNYQMLPSQTFIGQQFSLDMSNPQNHVQQGLQSTDMTNLESILKNNKILTKVNQRNIASHQNSTTQHQNILNSNFTTQGNANLQQYPQTTNTTNNSSVINQMKSTNNQQNQPSVSQGNQQNLNQQMVSNSQANQSFSHQVMPLSQMNQNTAPQMMSSSQMNQNAAQPMMPITQINQNNQPMIPINQVNQQNLTSQLISNTQGNQQTYNHQMVTNSPLNPPTLSQQIVSPSQINQSTMQSNQPAQGYPSQSQIVNNQFADHNPLAFNQPKLSFIQENQVSQGAQNVGVSTQQDHSRNQTNRLSFLQPQAQTSQSEQHSIPKLQQMQSNGMPPILQILNNAEPSVSADQTNQGNTNHQPRQLTGILMTQQQKSPQDTNPQELQKDKGQVAAQNIVDPGQMQSSDKTQNQQFYQASVTGLQQQFAQVSLNQGISRPQKSTSQVQFQSQHMIQSFPNLEQQTVNNTAAGTQNGILVVQQLPVNVKPDQNSSPNSTNNS